MDLELTFGRGALARSWWYGLAFSATLGIGADGLAQSAENDDGLFGEDEQTFRIGTRDRNVTFSPYVQLDGGYVALEPGPDGWEDNLRLARLYVFGRYDEWSATAAYEFDNDPFPVRYAFVARDLAGNARVQLGQQDEPFSLQDYSGSRFLPFAEAGQSASLIPGDRIGAVVKSGGTNHSLAGGIFAGDVNNGFASQGWAVTGRATWAPIYEESAIERGGRAATDGVGVKRVNDLLHLGIALSARHGIDDPSGFSGGASSSLVGRSIASVGELDGARSLDRVNLELARSHGSLSFQGEWTGALVNGGPEEGFAHGGYAYVTYFLTGERRGYDRTNGTFGRVVPKSPLGSGGHGAFEVGARLDYLDLEDLGPNGGAQLGASLVANAYLTKRWTVTGDYSFTTATSGPDDGLDVHAATARLQYAY